MEQPPRLSDRIVDQVERLGLTTVSLVAKGLAEVTRDQAKLALGQLATNGRLFRHELWQRRARQMFIYHTSHERPFRRRDLPRAVACAEYLMHTIPLQWCLPPSEQQELLAIAGQKCEPQRVEFTPCFLGRYASGQKALSVVLAMPHDDLQRVIADLDWYADRKLAIWLPLLSVQMLRVVVLVPNRIRADELERWLRRRPLLGRVGGTLRPIPVSIAQWRMLGG